MNFPDVSNSTSKFLLPTPMVLCTLQLYTEVGHPEYLLDPLKGSKELS